VPMPLRRSHRDDAEKVDGRALSFDIAELLSSTPPALDELFADPIVRLRIGTIVARAVREPTRPQRRAKPR
jgi:hypothetical protein